MRKLKLLLTMLVLLVGGGLSANAYQTPTADGIYYLYNTGVTSGSPGFMSTGNDYGFQVVIDNFGLPLKLVSTEADNTYKFQFIHHNGWLSDDGYMYSDGGTDRARTITVQDQGDGKYKLLNTNNSKEIENWYGNIVGDGTGNRRDYLWQFLSKAERDAMVAGYATSVKLAAATSMGMPADVDTESEFDSYLSTNYIGIDQSSKIQNGTFDTNHNTEGWTTSANSNRNFNIGWGNTEPKTTPEVYEGAGALSQTVTVDKVGLYKVSVNATYRCGNAENNNRVGDLGYDGSVAYLKANDNIAKVSDWYSGKINGNGPDSPSEANSTYFSVGKYLTEVFVYVGDAKTIDISLHSHAFTWGGWLMFNNFKLTYYSNEVSDADATTILGTADALLAKEMDATIKSNLTSARNTFDGARTVANYNALNALIPGAQASADAYALFAPERTKALALGMTSEAIAAVAPDVNALKVAEYNFVTTNYAYGVELGAWTTTGETATNKGQHWDGTDTSTYLEQLNRDGDNPAGWHAEFWEVGYNQNVELPAGNYVFKVAGRRSSSDLNLSLIVKNGSDVLGSVNDFPMGDIGKGIDTSGATNFGDGTYANNGSGRGFEWRYVKFTLAAPATVNVAVSAKTTTQHQWMSFCNPTVQTDNEANISLIAYNIALNDANTAFANDDYKNVTGSEKTELQTAIDADNTLNKTDKDAIDAAKTTLVEKTTAFTSAKAAYDGFVAAKAAEYEDNLPYANATKFAAIATAQGAAAATSKSDAETKANAILSAYRKYVESNALAEGVVGAQQIVITDPDMDVVYDSENHKFGVWQVIGQTNGTINLFDNESFTDGDGKNDYKYANIQKNDNNAGIQQTVNLDEGKYLLTVTARAQNTQDAAFWVFGDDNRSQITRIGNSGGTFGRGWNDFSVEFYVLGNKDVNIGVQSGNGKNMWWSATRFRLMRIGDAVESVTVTDAGYATYVSTLPLDYTSTEIKAYTAKVAAGKVVLTQINKVPANTPVVLYKEGGATEDIPVAASTDTPAASDLVAGTGAAVATADGETHTNYILNNGGNGIGFYLANDKIVAANRAYLHVPNSEKAATARLTIVFDDQTTGIADLKATANGDAIYNLNGQRIEKATKGIYIIGGKKMMKK